MSMDPSHSDERHPHSEYGAGFSDAAPPAAFRLFEAASVVFCVALDAALAWELASWWAPSLGAAGLAAALAAAVLGYLAADLVSGIVHFFGDSFGTVETPIIGRTFLLPFRSHHVDPQDICHHDFVETNGNNAFAALFLLAPTLLFVPLRSSPAGALFGAFALVFTIAVLLTNQIHKWAHVERPPPIARLLQRCRVFLSPEQHRAHHSPPHGRGYCVTCGVFNSLLDPIDFFAKLERLIRRLLRLPPRRP